MARLVAVLLSVKQNYASLLGTSSPLLCTIYSVRARFWFVSKNPEEAGISLSRRMFCHRQLCILEMQNGRRRIIPVCVGTHS
ncbi:hypothetical protein BDP27DRAFT_584231 [Rhodocollybia butyracea]|uniref:Uncharacterized protein n=1 Tax=Rhodocollybia butyracea TaxID=206335 RepID=A0A9P5PVI9_9AGAR|nr:hypothetical protein BDP27DRAFT_584231 [Rhodocollybia butyracea]